MYGEYTKILENAVTIRIKDGDNDKLAASLDSEDRARFKQYEELAVKARKHPMDEVVLILAVTAWEAFGPNDNGDALFSRPIYKIKEKGTIPKTHKSFETRAMLSRNHQYSSPMQAVGDILHAAYIPKYKRIEVLARYDWHKATRECNRIRSKKALINSMGYRIYSPELPSESGEFCSYCGKHARKNKDRCPHLKGMIGSIIDGIPVFMMNGLGFFVDLSSVGVPGDFNVRTVWRASSGEKDGK